MTPAQLRQIIKEKKVEHTEVEHKLKIAEIAEADSTRDGYERVKLIHQITALTQRSWSLANEIHDLREQLERLE